MKIKIIFVRIFIFHHFSFLRLIGCECGHNFKWKINFENPRSPSCSIRLHSEGKGMPAQGSGT